MRAVVLALLIATPAIADDVCVDEDGNAKNVPAITHTATSGDATKALERCGNKCRTIRERLAKRTNLIAAVDPTGKLLFEIDDGYPARGTLWSMKTGKRISRFPVDEFGGPPPPVSFDHLELVGRHVFAGDPNNDYRISYDIYTGALDVMFQTTRIAKTFVIEVDGMGRVDLRDYAQAGAPIVATRRVTAHAEGDPTLIAHVIVDGDHAVVFTELPAFRVEVDARKRKVSLARPLPRCK